jgi:D-glycero-D-manno-heptose 1,7-bisphosphate phosphatase
MAKYNIDKKKSLMIGDTARDVEAAEKAGVHGLLIQPNSNKFRLLEEEILKINQ